MANHRPIPNSGAASSSSAITLRAAASSDAADIADVYWRSRTELVACAPLTHTFEEVREWITDLLVPSGEVVVALIADRLVGLSATSSAYGVMWLDQLYVDPTFVGRGVGAALLDDAIARASEHTTVQLYTFSDNARARAFYERHRFAVIAQGDGSSNEEGVPDVLYQRRPCAPDLKR